MDFKVLREQSGKRGPKIMLFWDFWKLHHMDNVELVQNRPADGYTLDDCCSLKYDDRIRFPLRWKERNDLAELLGKPVRLHVKFYNARIYSLRADHHIFDAHDYHRIEDGLPILNTEVFGS